MNRRRFLAGLGAAIGTMALVTKLGQSTLPQLPRDISAYLTDPDAWYLITPPKAYEEEAVPDMVVEDEDIRYVASYRWVTVGF